MNTVRTFIQYFFCGHMTVLYMCYLRYFLSEFMIFISSDWYKYFKSGDELDHKYAQNSKQEPCRS